MPAFPAVGDPGTDTVSPPNDWASKLLAGNATTVNLTTGNLKDGAVGEGLLTLGTGDAVSYANTTSGQRLALKRGTAASPDSSVNPILKVERTMQVAHTSFAGDGFEACAAILGMNKGTTTNDGQVVGVAGFSTSASTTVASTGGDDACGLYGLGRVTGSSTGTGIGGFFNGRRDTNTGRAVGIEVSIDNNTATADSYNPSSFSGTEGIWLHATGTARSAVGLLIGNPFNVQLDVGVGIIGQGTGGPILSASWRDDGQAVTALDINGTHTNILDTQGATISGKLFKITTPGTYTPTNVTTDRSFNADATTLDEIADVLGTRIADDQTLGLVG